MSHEVTAVFLTFHEMADEKLRLAASLDPEHVSFLLVASTWQIVEIIRLPTLRTALRRNPRSGWVRFACLYIKGTLAVGYNIDLIPHLTGKSRYKAAKPLQSVSGERFPFLEACFQWASTSKRLGYALKKHVCILFTFGKSLWDLTFLTPPCFRMT